MIDITKIPENLKNLLINIILLPFWIVSIYIYNPELYRSNDFLIIGSVCICLTIISSILMSYVLMNTKKKQHILEMEILIPSIALQSILLSLIIFLGYIFDVIFGYIFLFYGFLTTYFVILFSFVFINLFIRKKD